VKSNLCAALLYRRIDPTLIGHIVTRPLFVRGPHSDIESSLDLIDSAPVLEDHPRRLGGNDLAIALISIRLLRWRIYAKVAAVHNQPVGNVVESDSLRHAVHRLGTASDQNRCGSCVLLVVVVDMEQIEIESITNIQEQ
jgi:hypothetical protein